jgi:prepilin peptidase CpaA
MLFFAVAVLVSAAAALEDWRSGRISNVLTLGALALAPLVHFGRTIQLGGSLPDGLLSGGMSILGALACGVAPYVLFVKGGARGGDVKLCAALGAILKPIVGIEAVFYGFLAAALIAPARLAYEGKLLRTLKSSFALLINPLLPKARRVTVDPEAMTWVRMGPAFFLGVVVTTGIHYAESRP